MFVFLFFVQFVSFFGGKGNLLSDTDQPKRGFCDTKGGRVSCVPPLNITHHFKEPKSHTVF